MKWSIKVARIAGIDVRIHLTFFLLLAWIAYSHYVAEGSIAAALGGLLLIALVFGSVVLHEFGHALMARRYGIETRDITLLPIGGVAALERMPDDPKQELAVSIAGPAVNLAIAAICVAIVNFIGRLDLPIHPLLPGGSLLLQLAGINLMLALFNMVPAFPMDGGRVLRALLAMRMSSARATRVAARIGQALALVFGVLGLLFNPILAFIALFVWMGASNENQVSQLDAALEGIPVEYAMVRRLAAVSPDQPLETAVVHVLEGFQHDFPVLDGGRIVGVLTRDQIVRGLSGGGGSRPIREVMSTSFERAQVGEMLSRAHKKLASCDCSAMPVVDHNGRLVGMLTFESIGELLMVRKALEAREDPRRAI